MQNPIFPMGTDFIYLAPTLHSDSSLHSLCSLKKKSFSISSNVFMSVGRRFMHRAQPFFSLSLTCKMYLMSIILHPARYEGGRGGIINCWPSHENDCPSAIERSVIRPTLLESMRLLVVAWNVVICPHDWFQICKECTLLFTYQPFLILRFFFVVSVGFFIKQIMYISFSLVYSELPVMHSSHVFYIVKAKFTPFIICPVRGVDSLNLAVRGVVTL